MNFDVKQIMDGLPHRYPFLLVDRILDVEVGRKVVALKNVTMNEEFFQGHFPGNPIMPGVLIIEALAQASAILAMQEPRAEGRKLITYFMSIERAKFRKPVVPGDQLRLEVSVAQRRGDVWKLDGKAFVEDTLVAESTFVAMVSEKEI